MPIISLFNNKGGVGKTTFLFHVAHVLADRGRKVLMVDSDSQCNLTAYALHDKAIEKAWEENGNSASTAQSNPSRAALGTSEIAHPHNCAPTCT